MYKQHSSTIQNNSSWSIWIIKILFALFILATLNACSKGYGCYTQTETIENNTLVNIEETTENDQETSPIICE